MKSLSWKEEKLLISGNGDKIWTSVIISIFFIRKLKIMHFNLKHIEK